MRPLAIDLFCGLGSGKPELGLRADALIEQPMARWAEDPNHKRLRILHLPIRTVAPELWSVSKFDNPGFSTGLAGVRKIWEFSTKPNHHAGILKLPAPVINPLCRWVLPVERRALFLRGDTRAILRAISSIAVRPHDLKLTGAGKTRDSAWRIALFFAPDATSLRLASKRAIPFIWPLSGETSAAV